MDAFDAASLRGRSAMSVDGASPAGSRSSIALKAVVDALNGGQPGTAFQACSRLLAQRPHDPALNELGATAAHRAGNHEDALALARRSLAARPDHVPTLTLLGRSARALGLYGDAASAFSRVVELQPGRAEAAFLLCTTSLQAGRPQANAMLRELLARFPEEAAGWEDLGQVLLGSGKADAAVVCLSRAMQIAPRFPAAMQLGLALRELGRFPEAAGAFLRATALNPGSSRAWFMLGLACQDEGDLPGAAAAYRSALSTEPALAEAALNLGTVLQEEGDLEGAKAAYGRAVELRPESFGRVAQAIATSPKGELWLDLQAFRRSLAG